MATLKRIDSADDPFEVGAEVTIGRAPENSLPIEDDAEVSREHARIAQGGEGYTLFDLGSRNGTHVERQGRRWQIAPKLVLRDGDVIIIGKTRFHFQAGTATRLAQRDALQTVVGQVVPPLRREE